METKATLDINVLLDMVKNYERNLAELRSENIQLANQIGELRDLAADAVSDATLSWDSEYLYAYDPAKVNRIMLKIDKYDYCARLDKLRGEKDDHSTTTE